MPTAFVCNCDLTARRVIRALAQQGLRVPQDVSVVGFDDYLSQDATQSLPLTTYAVDMPGMAQRATELLVARIGGDSSPARVEVCSGSLVERSTVRALAGVSAQGEQPPAHP